jgi:uncharacterized glyoxalase superfamily protein PhnB
MTVKPAIIPGLRYKDAPRAIDFLCEAFGFERHAVYPDPNDPSIIMHAQLIDRGNMIMLGSGTDGEYKRRAGIKSVAEAGGATMGLYITVDDVEAHAERARAAGADIFLEPQDQDYGGRGYSCRDIEGNVWSFGSYDPFAATD